ncbi:MAG: cytochrome P450, partial [Acidimicrobiia bacterium]
MRVLPPLVYVAREVVAEVELHGTVMPVGAEVRLAIGSANRDERVYDAPDDFRLDRADLHVEHRSAPTVDGRTAHLAFGAGPHFCVGYQLARLETITVSNLLLDRLPGIRLVEPSAPVVDGPTRSVGKLVVSGSPAR